MKINQQPLCLCWVMEDRKNRTAEHNGWQKLEGKRKIRTKILLRVWCKFFLLMRKICIYESWLHKEVRWGDLLVWCSRTMEDFLTINYNCYSCGFFFYFSSSTFESHQISQRLIKKKIWSAVSRQKKRGREVEKCAEERNTLAMTQQP